ncbi:MAG: 5-formyltetrahydrofolate cyclo-ligase [Deltaproteobacteria bacterium]|nr:5-formyltetrahydrofolate cyclo-ligase [Deltaproteobacteria bacterium]
MPTPTTQPTLKSEIREALKNQRSKISAEHSLAEGFRALKFFRSHYKKFDHWLLYAPIQNEISTEPLYAELKSHQKKIYFPRIEKEKINFYQVSDWSELKKSSYTIEPSEKSTKLSTSEKVVVVVPGIAFSRFGHRIGFGKGFYDRYLNEHPEFFRIGFGYDIQILMNDWKIDSNDESMNQIICPSGFFDT